MREVDQKLLDFAVNESFNENDYYVSSSNYFAKNIIQTWPKWDKKIINITGEKYCGKTHLSTIFKIKKLPIIEPNIKLDPAKKLIGSSTVSLLNR